ncbi:hypothetical protein MLD38_027766 [Melastoma candidum]|uniref:Uncharacterized protein n=1 Tax=Melastoma candidum TaxID=119954 RepID=A0ACB9P380_9MYRT|nr:hypothetical protein MLD38_027766 [Melastoma candidum]
MSDDLVPLSSSSSKQPQISDMFHKFALAVKSKTYELFSDELQQQSLPLPSDDDDCHGEGASSAVNEVILGQRVVVLRPDSSDVPAPTPSVAPPPTLNHLASSPRRVMRPQSLSHSRRGPEVGSGRNPSFPGKSIDLGVIEALISSVFATLSSFEASYVQLQISHSPFDEAGVKSADEALVGHLQRLCHLCRFFLEYCQNPNLVYGRSELSISSFLEARVQENQSKLRILGMISNKLQLEMDAKDHEVAGLKDQLADTRRRNLRLSRRLTEGIGQNCEVSLSIKVFEGVLNDACRASHKFTKVLIRLMRMGGWDLITAARSLYNDIDFVRASQCCYAFLSYVCLVMFRGFDSDGFGTDTDKGGSLCNGHHERINDSLKRLLEHISGNPLEVLSMDSGCEFARFCDSKYKELINVSMESNIFGYLDGSESILNSWRSLSVFYNSFVEMASSIWTLHKLAFSFDPVVEIFQVERGVEYCMIYMDDVLKRYTAPSKVRPRVGFTVVPGFRIKRTVAQCKVYLSGSDSLPQESPDT